ncbi:unnamed protein product [Moneuplotes crassus]|uniref:Uncharacterized protein n=1 Tax=Euplotes crassus TaxID=5936 RepID=A0AAD1Y2J1_EUPCR|nr:unnamed protein product [Moneuplotes crassus]
MESNNKFTEEENACIISLEKSVLEETKEQDITRSQSILHKIFPKKKEIEPLDSDSGEVSKRNSRLYIDFRDLRNAKLAQSFKHLKFFDTNFVDFGCVDSKNKHFCDFLESSFPDKTNHLCLYSWNKMDLKRSNYLNSLLRVSSKVLQRVTFDSFCIGLPSLKKLVTAYKHARVLRLWDCRLAIPSVPDFSKALTNCQIQKLGLDGSGCSDLSDWENNFHEFKNLVQGLASSPDLRLSLKEVVICNCGVNQIEAKNILEENQLGGVKIITED